MRRFKNPNHSGFSEVLFSSTFCFNDTIMVSLPTAEQTGIGEEATLEANKAVESLLTQQNGGKRKRKPYRRFSDTDRAVIGKYAAEHGNAEAMKRFKQEFPELPESTVRSFKIKYTSAVEAGQSSGEAIDKIPSKRRGRPKLLGDYDTQVQQFVKALQQSGTVVTPQVVIAAAEGIVSANNKELLSSNGGNVSLKKTWAVSLMKRVGLRKSRATKSTGSDVSLSSEGDTSCMGQILNAISTHNIPLELVIGWEQFDLPVIPDGYSGGTDGDELDGGNSTRSIIGLIAVTMAGSVLPFQLVYDGISADCHPYFSFPSDFSIFHHPRQASNKESILNFMTKIVLPYVQKIRFEKGLKASHPAVLIHQALTDGEEDMISLLQDNSIIPITLPSDCTECDLTFPVYQFVEEHLTEKFRSWYSDEVKQQLDKGKRVEDISVDLQYSRLKELQSMWLVSAFEYIKANPTMMTSGFEKSGIINPNNTST